MIVNGSDNDIIKFIMHYRYKFTFYIRQFNRQQRAEYGRYLDDVKPIIHHQARNL
jgi:hypothetical protein